MADGCKTPSPSTLGVTSTERVLICEPIDRPKLQSQQEGSKNRIGRVRSDFNEAVRDYNADPHTFPGAIWAVTLYGSSKTLQLFETTGQKAPNLEFSSTALPWDKTQ
jgi:hypothetical protein